MEIPGIRLAGRGILPNSLHLGWPNRTGARLLAHRGRCVSGRYHSDVCRLSGGGHRCAQWPVVHRLLPVYLRHLRCSYLRSDQRRMQLRLVRLPVYIFRQQYHQHVQAGGWRGCEHYCLHRRGRPVDDAHRHCGLQGHQAAQSGGRATAVPASDCRCRENLYHCPRYPDFLRAPLRPHLLCHRGLPDGRQLYRGRLDCAGLHPILQDRQGFLHRRDAGLYPRLSGGCHLRRHLRLRLPVQRPHQHPHSHPGLWLYCCVHHRRSHLDHQRQQPLPISAGPYQRLPRHRQTAPLDYHGHLWHHCHHHGRIGHDRLVCAIPEPALRGYPAHYRRDAGRLLLAEKRRPVPV